MANVDPTEILMIAQRVKRQTSNSDVVSLCDALIALVGRGTAPCPVCAERRAVKAAAQKRWRKNRSRQRLAQSPLAPGPAAD